MTSESEDMKDELEATMALVNGRLSSFTFPNLSTYAATMNPVIAAVQRMSAPIGSYSGLFGSLNATLLPFQNSLSHFQRIANSQFAQQAAFIAERELRREERDRSLILTLTDAGWALPMRVPISFNRRCLAFADDHTPEETQQFLDSSIIEIHNNELLEQILRHWADLEPLSRRFQVLSEAVEAHILGLYSASIPTLLAQIEGIIFEASNHDGWMTQSKVQGYIDTILASNDRYLPIRGLILDELYQNFNWGDPISRRLSRHAILHGADVEYGTQKNSLRVILLLDFFVCLIYS